MEDEGFDCYEEEHERIERAKPRLWLITKLWFIFGLWDLAKYHYGRLRRRILRRFKDQTGYLTVFTHAGRSVYVGEPSEGRYPFHRHTHTFMLESKDFTAVWADDGALEVKRAHAER